MIGRDRARGYRMAVWPRVEWFEKKPEAYMLESWAGVARRNGQRLVYWNGRSHEKRQDPHRASEG